MFALAAPAVLANPLVVRAASTVAKKAFDVVARNSLRGITDILSERFKGNAEVMKLRDELELKVDVLSLPVDICVQHALQGNSALQGALNVALKVLQDIEDYEASLRQQEIDIARGSAGWTPDKTSVGQAVRKLESLIKQLDSLLPYLSVAINAVNLLNTGPTTPTISPSRLMGASWQLRSAPRHAAAPIFSIPKAIWHRQGLAPTASGKTPMQTLYPLCAITLRRPAEEEEVNSQGGGVAVGFEYELHIQQDLDDGAYHEEEEQADCLSLKVQNIVALEWATSHSLGLGSNDYTPALLVHAIKSTSGETGGSSVSAIGASVGSASGATPTSLPPSPLSSSSSTLSRQRSGRSLRASASAPRPSGPQHKYALRCFAAEDAPQNIQGSSTQWSLLSQFEYVLRLCMLETREEAAHHELGVTPLL
ncbi:hypothetical protein ABBQ32_005419 [Trebouxia sp. C0010 RCD-2024]